MVVQDLVTDDFNRTKDGADAWQRAECKRGLSTESQTGR